MLLLLIPVVSYISAKNSGAQYESSIKAAHADGKNVYTQYVQQVKEAAQIPDMQVEGLVKVVTAAIEARYGKDGSKAMFQFLQEQNPNMNQETYLRIQDIIISGRKDFRDSQSRLIDLRRSYELSLNSFWSGLWLDIAGFPKMNMGTDYLPISSVAADAVYEKGREDGPLTIH